MVNISTISGVHHISDVLNMFPCNMCFHIMFRAMTHVAVRAVKGSNLEMDSVVVSFEAFVALTTGKGFKAHPAHAI